eukprot:1960877-Prymnesium_polylepis.1
MRAAPAAARQLAVWARTTAAVWRTAAAGSTVAVRRTVRRGRRRDRRTRGWTAAVRRRLWRRRRWRGPPLRRGVTRPADGAPPRAHRCVMPAWCRRRRRGWRAVCDCPRGYRSIRPHWDWPTLGVACAVRTRSACARTQGGEVRGDANGRVMDGVTRLSRAEGGVDGPRGWAGARSCRQMGAVPRNADRAGRG